MKTEQLLTQELKTGDITVISNVTSVTVTGHKIARLEGAAAEGQANPSAVHIDFIVKQPSHLSAVLEDTEELGLILKLDDAVKLGALLIEMGMRNNPYSILPR